MRRTHSQITRTHLVQPTGIDRTECVAEHRQAKRLESARDLAPVFYTIIFDRIDITRNTLHNRSCDRLSYLVRRFILTDSPQVRIVRCKAPDCSTRRTLSQEFPQTPVSGSGTRSMGDPPSIEYRQELFRVLDRALPAPALTVEPTMRKLCPVLESLFVACMYASP